MTTTLVVIQVTNRAITIHKLHSATLHGAFVAPGLLAVTEYKAHLSGDTGRFANATDDMSFIGEIDFNTGNVVLRYSEAVCVSGSN